MKISDIKYINQKEFCLDINDKNIYLRVIKLLLKNGFRWTSIIDESVYSNYMLNNHIIVYCNYNGNYLLSYATRDSRENDITIDEYNYQSLVFYFNPIPDYKPKKFSREI
jgi:hypothetical protein